MNAALKQKLLELDELMEPIGEFSISSRINEVSRDDDCVEALAERMAFSFCEEYADKKTGWGTYYGPMSVMRHEDGNIYESPSIRLVTKEILDYWLSRAGEVKNPLMKSRYYGLVFDFSETVLGERASHQVATSYVNALIEVVNKGFDDHPTQLIKKAKRAYQVSCLIRNEDLKGAAIQVNVNLEDRIAVDDKPGLWGFCFEEFILGKERSLRSDIAERLVSDLESRLTRVSSGESPWVTESAAVPLASYYRIKGQNEEVRRVIGVLGTHFDRACKSADPMLASSWYQHMHDVYVNFNMNDMAQDITKKIAEIGPSVIDSMQTFKHEQEISREDLEKYLQAMTSGGLEKSLERIAIRFMPSKGEIERQVKELAQNHPLTYLFTKTLQDHKGRPVATIGGIEDDLEGNTIHQLSQDMGIEAFFLRHSVDRVVELYGATEDAICDFIFQSPLFEESKKEIIRRGIRAYLEKDYIAAIQVIIPQAEAALRNLVELSGGPIMKKNRQGGLQLRTFDEILRDETVTNCFGGDAAFYFRVLLTDQRGWNLRNDMCHGISPLGTYNYATADRVLHVMLCLSQARARDA